MLTLMFINPFLSFDDRIDMDLTTWNNLHDEDKFKTFQDYLHDKLSHTPDLADWLNWVALMMAEKIRNEALVVIKQKLPRLMDERYIHQLTELDNILQKLVSLLDKKQPDRSQKELKCQKLSSYKLRKKLPYYHSDRCYHFMNNVVYKGTTFCHLAFSNMEEWSAMILDKFMSFYVSNMYYVLKLKLSIFPQDIQMPPFSNVDDWEVVCEDEDYQLLSHPLLPHPRDFLTYKKCEGNRYADKAKFEYYMEGSFDTCSVVLTNSPSIIPKLLTTSYKDEEVILTKQKDTIPQYLYHENTKGHKKGSKKPKKRLSRILKETRKKKKTRTFRPPSKPDAYEDENEVDLDYDDVYKYDDYYDDDDDDDYYDDYYDYYNYYDDCDYY